MANWWQAEESKGYVQIALGHINGAQKANLSSTERCMHLFNALNQLWAGHNQAYLDLHGQYYNLKPEEYPSDNKSFSYLLTEGIQEPLRKQLVTTQELQQLVNFEPKIQNHDVSARTKIG